MTSSKAAACAAMFAIRSARHQKLRPYVIANRAGLRPAQRAWRGLLFLLMDLAARGASYAVINRPITWSARFVVDVDRPSRTSKNLKRSMSRSPRLMIRSPCRRHRKSGANHACPGMSQTPPSYSMTRLVSSLRLRLCLKLYS